MWRQLCAALSKVFRRLCRWYNMEHESLCAESIRELDDRTLEAFIENPGKYFGTATDSVKPLLLAEADARELDV